MNHRRLWLVLICFFALPGYADDKQWYAGMGAGIFDGDFDDSEQPHLESLGINLYLGYPLNAYLGIETQIEYVAKDTQLDEDNFVTEFSGMGLTAGLVLQFPLDREDEVALYSRLGGTFWDYKMASQSVNGSVETRTVTPHLALGIKSRFLFLEYVNYGKEHGLHLEQLRCGIRVSF